MNRSPATGVDPWENSGFHPPPVRVDFWVSLVSPDVAVPAVSMQKERP